MTELSTEAQRLIEAARQLNLPTPADKVRVLAKLKTAQPGSSHPSAGGALAIKATIASIAVLAIGLALRQGNDAAELSDELRLAQPKFANTKLEATQIPIAAPPVRNPTPVEKRRAASRPENSTVAEPPPAISELVLMRRARVALRDGDPSAALVLMEEHERLFPDSVLIEERWTTRALAACTLGQYERAEAAIAALRERSPSSEHLARIQRVCEKSP